MLLSSSLCFWVLVKVDIFVFRYYSPILVFPVQLLFRRFWFLLWGFCFINACCVWQEMLFVFGVLVLAFDVLFRACIVFCTNCCSNMHLVFDKGMMMVGGMFPNIFMHV